MKIIDLIATQLEIDKKTQTIAYKTGQTYGPGMIVLDDKNGIYDMVLTSNVHSGGEVILRMRPFRTPAKRYEIGDKIGVLITVNE